MKLCKAKLEEYICAIYGKCKMKDINLVRSAIFWNRYNKKKKIVDFCMLPPCKGNIRLHFSQANYVAYTMRHAHLLRPGLQTFSFHGSNETTGEAEWMTTLTPQDIVDMFMATLR